MNTITKIRDGIIKIEAKKFPIQFGLISNEEGIYKLEIFFNDDYEIAKIFIEENLSNFINQRFDLEGRDENFNLIELTDLQIIKVRCSPKNIVNFISYGFFRITKDNNLSSTEDHKKEKEDEVFHIELEGFEMLFTDITHKPKYRRGTKIKDFNDFERDHSSTTISIKENGTPFHRTYLFRFHSPDEFENTIITIESITKPRTKFFTQEYCSIKTDLVNYLSFINGGFVRVRREFTGSFYALNKIESEVTTTYSFKQFKNQIKSDYVPLRDGFSRGNHILHHCLGCFQKFRELNKFLDINSIIIMLNGTNEAPTIEQKFFTLMVAMERLGHKYVEHKGRQDIEILGTSDYEPIKEELLKTISRFRRQIGDDNKLNSLKGKLGELHLIKKNDTKNKFIKLLEFAKISESDEINDILFIVRHSSVHKGEIGTGNSRIKNYLELDKLLRDIILNIVGYEGKRKIKHWE